MSRFSYCISVTMVLAACADESTAPLPDSPAAAKRVEVSASATVTVLMSGLDAPRGLAWGPEGGLYVAEAGTSQINGPCAAVARGANCFSGTGAVSRWWKGKQERVASGLPSSYTAAFQDIIGPQDLAFQGRRAFVSVGWGGDPAARAQLGEFAAGLGWVIQLTPSGHWREVADVGGFEGDENPDGRAHDTNPFGLLAEGGRRFVADAGGNSLLQVEPSGDVSLVSTFPRTPAPPQFGGGSDPVPTEVQRGPDGALYVSTLSGVPFLPGAARIYRVSSAGTPTVYADGFKTITDFTFAPDGGLYVLEYASGPFLTPPGRVVRVAPNGVRTVITTALTNPTGILLGPDGAIYVSNFGNLDNVGEVLRIVP